MKRQEEIKYDNDRKQQQFGIQSQFQQHLSPQRMDVVQGQYIDENQRFNVPIVSGKKHKALTLNLYSIQRQNSYKTYRFTPLRNIMITSPNSNQNHTPTTKLTPSHQKTQNHNKNQAELISQQRFKNDELKIKLQQKLCAKQQLVQTNYILKQKLRQLNRLNQQTYVDVQKLQDQLASDIFQVKQLVKEQQSIIFTSSKELFLSQRRIADVHILLIQKQNIMQSMKKVVEEESLIEAELIQVKLKRDAELSKKDEELYLLNLKMKQFRLQISVLKMQINPLVRVGFSSISNDSEQKKKVLQKDSTLWQKRNKNLVNDEVKYFIIIQLYKSWKQILNRFSSNFIGFQQILCQNYSKQRIQDLYNYIIQNQNQEFKQSKIKSYIVFYSPKEESYSNFCTVLTSMEGLNNEILSINNVSIYDNNLQSTTKILSINYTFRGENRQKTFQLVRLVELSKQSLSNYLPKNDKNVLFKIEVPLAFGSVAQLAKAEEAYKCLQRFK